MVNEEVGKAVGNLLGTDLQLSSSQYPIHSQVSSSLQSFFQVIAKQSVRDVVGFSVASDAEGVLVN